MSPNPRFLVIAFLDPWQSHIFWVPIPPLPFVGFVVLCGLARKEHEIRLRQIREKTYIMTNHVAATITIGQKN